MSVLPAHDVERLTVDLLLLVVLVLDRSEVDGSLVREKETVRGLPKVSNCPLRRLITHQVLVTGEEDSVQHGFVKKEVAHPLQTSARISSTLCTHLGDDNVHLVDG